MKIALLQMNMTVGDVAGNVDALLRGARKAASAGADLCLSAEMAVAGYPPRDLLLNRCFVKACLEGVDRLAADLPENMSMLVGSPDFSDQESGAPLFNAAFLLGPGGARTRFAKMLLPTYDVFDERRYFEPSRMANVCEIRGQRIGVTVCEDVWNERGRLAHRYQSNPLPELARAGVDAVVNLSASPFSLGKQLVREELLTALAAKYEVPFFYANQVGGNEDLVFDGRSLCAAPDGTVAARGAGFAEDVLVVDLDTLSGPVARDDFDVCPEAWRALVMGLSDYARKCGFKKAVLGLSGGVDSALTAAIAVAALGADAVTGVLMDSPYTSRQSIDDALELAENLGISTLRIPIGPLMGGFDAALAEAFAGREPDVTEENIQSRIRGNLLMALSNKTGAILLSTGNKSELAVGYCTIYGDMSGGLAVISDVPKTLVFELCRWLNKTKGREVIPDSVITRPPSAELRPDQLDQDELPDYGALDAILELMIENHASVDEISAKGFEADVVRKVHRLVVVSEFKRRQAAPGIKITDQAFGTGWRMPVAAKRDFDSASRRGND